MGVELIVGQTNQEIVEVHPTVPSPPGPVGPKGDKGDPGGWVYASGIANDVDLNTLTNPGTYRRSTSTGSTRALNYPTDGWAGWIEVIGASPGSLMQRATSIYSNAGAGPTTRNVWVRTHHGAWQEWMRIDTPSYGTGFPEGVVTAAAGSRYIDTAATNGAIEWIKTSGLGNTGWQVVYGDTGWRNLVSWDSLGNITNGALASTDYAPQPNLAGGIWVKRSGSRVHLEIARLAVTAPGSNQVLYNLPAGFRPKFAHRFGHEVWGTGGVKQAPFQALPGGNIGRGGNSGFAAGDYWIQASTTFDTPDSWPTALPGTAA